MDLHLPTVVGVAIFLPLTFTATAGTQNMSRSHHSIEQDKYKLVVHSQSEAAPTPWNEESCTHSFRVVYCAAQGYVAVPISTATARWGAGAAP